MAEHHPGPATMQRNPTMNPIEYNQRRDLANRLITHEVARMPRGASILAGLLGTAAVRGLVTTGPLGAWATPVLVHVPNAATTGDHNPRHRQIWTDKVSRLLGRPTAVDLITRAADDVARGALRPSLGQVAYVIDGHGIQRLSPAQQWAVVCGSGPTKVGFKADGTATVTKFIKGRVDSEH